MAAKCEKDYSRYPIKPCVKFFKDFLKADVAGAETEKVVTKTKIRVLIPPTVMFGFGHPVLFYTGQNGTIECFHNPPKPKIIQLFGENAKDDTIVACVKKVLFSVLFIVVEKF